MKHRFFPNTELCIDLKLLTRKPGRMITGKYLCGILTRDNDDHYTFIETLDKKMALGLGEEV